MSLARVYIILINLFCGIFSATVHSEVVNNPQIIAHRAGTADAPENTIPAISKSIKNEVDAVWITLQLSKDNIPVLYRPSDLQELTDKSGPVSAYTAQQLAKINASVAYNKKFNIKAEHIAIPTLDEILKKFPTTIFYLDIKSPDANPDNFAQSLQKILLATTAREKNRLQRTRIYSTNDIFLNAVDRVNNNIKESNQIQRFESRDLTRTMLVNNIMAHQCKLFDDKKIHWYGLEMQRDVVVVEKYTLGEGRSNAVLSWNKEAMDCFRRNNNAHIVFFGINTIEDYNKAKELQVDSVMVNSPALFKTIVNKQHPSQKRSVH